MNGVITLCICDLFFLLHFGGGQQWHVFRVYSWQSCATKHKAHRYVCRFCLCIQNKWRIRYFCCQLNSWCNNVLAATAATATLPTITITITTKNARRQNEEWTQFICRMDIEMQMAHTLAIEMHAHWVKEYKQCEQNVEKRVIHTNLTFLCWKFTDAPIILRKYIYICTCCSTTSILVPFHSPTCATQAEARYNILLFSASFFVFLSLINFSLYICLTFARILTVYL